MRLQCSAEQTGAGPPTLNCSTGIISIYSSLMVNRGSIRERMEEFVNPIPGTMPRR